MGACSKKLSKRDSRYLVKPTSDLRVRTEESNHQSSSRLPKPVPEEPSPHQDTETTPQVQPVSHSLPKPVPEYSDEPPDPPLIRHYEDQNELLKRYNLSPEDDRNPHKKKSMIVQKSMAVAVVDVRNEEDSFESSGSVAEGVVGTVH